jgi:3-methyladenine DNA glycosylase AlkD
MKANANKLGLPMLSRVGSPYKLEKKDDVDMVFREKAWMLKEAARDETVWKAVVWDVEGLPPVRWREAFSKIEEKEGFENVKKMVQGKTFAA